MARKKKTPANRYLRYELTNSGTPGTETSHFIDLAKDLSAINRRLYRQGRDYHVKRVSVISSNTIAGFGVGELIPGTGIDQEIVRNAGRVTVSTVHDTWVTRNAWRRGFEMWNQMNKLALDKLGDAAKPTFHDFKIYLSQDHYNGTKLTPKDNGGNNVQTGNWDYVEYESPDGTTSADGFTAWMHGGDNGSAGSRVGIGLVKSYSNTRSTVQNTSPDLPDGASDDALLNLFDDGTVLDEIAQNLEVYNDGTPYAPDNYPGGSANHPKPCVVQQTTLGVDGRVTMGGFNAVCGLLELETTSPIASDVYSVLVELAPGNYRGIAADVI